MHLLSLCCRMQISKAVTSGVSVSVTSMVAVVAAGAAIHLLYLAFNIGATSALRLGGSGQEGERMVTSAPGLTAWHFMQSAAVARHRLGMPGLPAWHLIMCCAPDQPSLQRTGVFVLCSCGTARSMRHPA